MRHIQTLLAFAILLFLSACNPELGNDKVVWKHNDNTVRVRLLAEVQTLNPYLSRGDWSRTAYELVFQYPVDFNRTTLKMEPMTVKAQPIVEDMTEGPYKGGRRYTYEFYDEAVWDDGKPVTGHDYEFALKTLFNPNLPTQAYANYLELIQEVQVDPVNPKRFTVLTNKNYLLAEPAVSNITLLPAHIYDPEGLTKNISFKEIRSGDKDQLAKNENLKKFAEAFLSPKYARETISGSGPYKLVDWVEQQRMVFAKKENWWGNKLASKNPMLQAYPDTIILIPIEDQTAAITALKAEDIDVLLEPDTKQFLDLRNDAFVTNVYDLATPPRFAFFYTAMQTRNPKLSDKRVRNAISRIIDVDAMIRDIYDGLGERIVGPFLPDKEYYHKGLEPIKMDQEKARELLAEAGWKDTNGNGIVDKMIDGKLTEMNLEMLYTPGSIFQENMTELYRNNAKKVGINIERVAVESNIMGQRMRNGDYELTGRGAGALPLPDDPKQLFHTDSAQPGGSNYTRFGNAESDALIDQIRSETDVEKRNQLYLKFQELIYDEQPMTFLFAPLNRVAVHKRFEPLYTRMSPNVSLQHLKLKGNQ